MRVLMGIAISLFFAAATNAQNGTLRDGPKWVVIEDVRGVSRRPKNIVVKLSPFTRTGTVQRIILEFNLSDRAKRSYPRLKLEEPHRSRLGETLSKGAEADKKILQTYATAIARSTYCRTGPIALNKKGRSYTSPANLKAIMEANPGKIIGGIIPPGLTGDPIPAIEYTSFVGLDPVWHVRLTCNSPNPY